MTPSRDVAALGRDLQRAVQADLRHRRRDLAGVALVIGLCATGVAGTWAGGRPDPPPAARPGPVGPSPAPVPPPSRPPTPTATSAPVPEPPPIGVTPDPGSLLVLVDHQRHLPPGYVPAELVEPAVPFTFSGPHPKRLLRPEAARALEGLFAAAAGDGLPLAAVSGYRSEQTQRDIHSLSVARNGAEVARRSSARPGHSEHQTGLAVDVAGADGACPATACFADRPEAAWLARHAPEHGFVVRYPRGKEDVTGYSYEPWHLRYVGPEVAGHLARTGLTLDEHRGAAPAPPR